MLGHNRLNIFSCSLAQRASLGPLLHHKGRKGRKGRKGHKGHKEPEALLVDTITGPFEVSSFASFVSFVVSTIIQTPVRPFRIPRSLQPSSSSWTDETYVYSRAHLSLATAQRGLSCPS